MNAASFLASQGRSIPLHPVTIRLVDPADPSRVADAPAVLRFVPERLRLAADDAAAESLAKLKDPTPDRRAAEEAHHFLLQAVKQADSPAANFFESVEQVRSMLIDAEALRLRAEYQRYKESNFPETLTEAEAQRIAKDARNFSLSDLLRSYGYWQILRVLPSLAIAFGASLDPRFLPTASASTPPATSSPSE